MKTYRKPCAALKRNKFYNAMAVMALLVSAKSVGQNRITITPELSKQALANFHSEDMRIYRAWNKEIEYHPYDTAQVPTPEYQVLLDRMARYKPHYDSYTEKSKRSAEGNGAIRKIVEHIDKFLSSDEKKEKKEQYLIDAQALADRYNIEITTLKEESSFKGLLKGVANDDSRYNPKPRKIVLYDKEHRTGKGDIKIYREEIQNMSFREPDQTYEYQVYVEAMDKASSIKKTETGQVVSDKIAKRQGYMIDPKPIDVATLSGTFVELPQKYMLVLSDIKGEFVKDELIYHPTTSTSQMSSRFPLIQKEGTDEFYYITSDGFLSRLTDTKQDNVMLDNLRKMGYPQYQKDGSSYIKTKTAEIRLDGYIGQKLKENLSYITTFDSDQAKIAAMMKQVPQLNASLDKYVTLYSVQRNKMSASNITAWKAVAKQAKDLQEKIWNLDTKYFGEITYELLQPAKGYEKFLDNLNTSKYVLGI